MLTALVLAAGHGTRMGPLTADCPKPLVPIAGRPALYWTLDWLRDAGVSAVTLNVHYRPAAFHESFGIQYCGMPVTYLEEPSLLGSAGTLRAYLASAVDTSMLVVYGDVLTNLPLRRLLSFHTTRPVHPSATLVVHRVADPQLGGVVSMEGDRIVSFEEKPAHPQSPFVFGGVAVVDAGIRPYVPDRVPCDLGRDVFPVLCTSAFPLYAYALEEADYLIDFGTPERYELACREWPRRLKYDPVPNPATD